MRPTDPGPPPSTPAGTARLVAALLLPAIAVAVGMCALRSVEATFLLYTLGGCLAGPWLLLGARPFGPAGSYPFLPPRGRRRAFARRALFLWLFFGPLLFVPYALLRPHLGAPHAYLMELESYGWVPSRVNLYAALFLVLVPWLEEWWWRGEALPRAVDRFGERAGLVIAVLSFASYHAVVLARLVPPASLAIRMSAILAGGFIWGIAARRDRAWGGCYLSHALGADLVIVIIFRMFVA